MFKLYCDDKEYDMIEAQVREESPYSTASYISGSSMYTTFLLTSMIIKLIDDNADLFEEVRDKLTQDILKDAVLFDPQSGSAYQIEALTLSQLYWEERILSLRGTVKGNLIHLENYLPHRKKLGFFNA